MALVLVEVLEGDLLEEWVGVVLVIFLFLLLRLLCCFFSVCLLIYKFLLPFVIVRAHSCWFRANFSIPNDIYFASLCPCMLTYNIFPSP